MRTVRYPKPAKRGPKPRARIVTRRPGVSAGDYRSRRKYALGLWRDLVRRKEPSGVCPMCRKRPWSDAAHCWAKGPHPALMLDLSNGAPLCRPDHRRVDSDHHAKEEFFARYMGQAEYERLRFRAQTRSKMDLGLTTIMLERLLAASKASEK